MYAEHIARIGRRCTRTERPPPEGEDGGRWPVEFRRWRIARHGMNNDHGTHGGYCNIAPLIAMVVVVAWAGWYVYSYVSLFRPIDSGLLMVFTGTQLWRRRISFSLRNEYLGGGLDVGNRNMEWPAEGEMSRGGGTFGFTLDYIILILEFSL